MEIHILRDGKQIGPFTEETVQSLLKQGNILINDLAWSPGLTGWNPLYAVLYPAAQPPVPPASAVPPPMPPPAPIPDVEEESPVAVEVLKPVVEPQPAPAPISEEPASPRQKAFLTYMAVPFNNELTKDRAALLVNDAMENPKYSGRLKKWDDERLRLYPDLFADEIKARRENRAQQFLDICQTEGAEFFEGVTKAHTQVLVGFLDVQYPTWDRTEHASKYDYFFPAIAEKFPQLLKKSAKGRFKYPDGPKVAAELVRSPVAVRARTRKSPVGAIVRGIVIGGIVLGLGVAAAEINRRGGMEVIKTWIVNASESAKPKPANSAKPAEPVISSSAIKEPVASTQHVPASAPAPSVPPAPPAPVANTAPVTPANPALANPVAPAPAAAAPTAEPTMVASAAPNAALPANVSLFDTTPPPASIPAADAPAPATPTAAAPPAPQRVYAKITKPTVINLRFGSSTLRPGTPVQVLSSSGSNLTIQFGPETHTIPASNTDYTGASLSPGTSP
jgi:hypothetical protein